MTIPSDFSCPPLQAADVAFVRVDETSRDEVLRRLGTPFFAIEDERLMGYASADQVIRVHGMLGWMSPSGVGHSQHSWTSEFFLLTWDDEGRIRRAGFLQVESFPHSPKSGAAVMAWAEAQ